MSEPAERLAKTVVFSSWNDAKELLAMAAEWLNAHDEFVYDVALNYSDRPTTLTLYCDENWGTPHTLSPVRRSPGE
jgi:hypothetical protein